MVVRARCACLASATRVEFELEACGMMLSNYIEQGEKLLGRRQGWRRSQGAERFVKGDRRHKSAQPTMAFDGAPMILTKYGQDGIPKGEFSFGCVSANEICLCGGEGLLAQHFLGQEQASAAIEEQTRGFRGRYLGGLKVMFASVKQGFRAEDDPMGCHQVVCEHRNRRASEPRQRINFEFHLKSR